MPCLYEALENSNWATRKASAETLNRIGSNIGSSLAFYKSKTLRALESCRFDKVSESLLKGLRFFEFTSKQMKANTMNLIGRKKKKKNGTLDVRGWMRFLVMQLRIRSNASAG